MKIFIQAITVSAMLGFLSIPAYCQEQKTEETRDAEHSHETHGTLEKAATEWKEQVEFHKVMASTFHPMEEGDFKPIRERSVEMMEKAEAWAKSKAPAGKDTPEIKSTLEELVSESRKLNDLIQKETNDKEIGMALTHLHDTFHKIAGLCRESK
ncbi:MAG: hypothetical protein IT242_06665 [Bacteroidia bacterium]|nr:hypothetical protein [Bacteroidia bacterium]